MVTKNKMDTFVVFVCVSPGNIFERQFGNDNFDYESMFAYIQLHFTLNIIMYYSLQ